VVPMSSDMLMSDRRPLDSSSSSEPSRAVERAGRSSPGEWSEGLEPFGQATWVLPGQGERGSGCGEWYPEAVCETCGETRFKARVCGARSCPDCWGVWAKEAGVRASLRVQAFRYTQPDDWHRQVAHAYVSPTEGSVRTADEYWEGRSKAAEIAKEKGWRGFTVIPHPYRPTEEAKEKYRQEDPDYGIWVWLRNDIEGMERFIKWSPHYHIIGFPGADMEPGKDSDEWLYQFKRSLERFDGIHDRDSHEDLYGAFRYLLSHTGFREGSTKQVLAWYGDLANSVFVEDATEDWQHQKPSDGVMSALKREIEAVAGRSEETEDGEVRPESDDVGDCPDEDCDGILIDVFDVSSFLQHNDPPPEVRDRMVTARDWRLGRIEPPPGMKRPRSEGDAKEAFQELL